MRHKQQVFAAYLFKIGY